MFVTKKYFKNSNLQNNIFHKKYIKYKQKNISLGD